MASRILIAEDNETLAASLQGLLQRRGLTVERVGDGVGALQRITADPPALLLLDLRLPGLHGIEVLKKLRHTPSTRRLPVILMTGVYRGERYRQAAERLGVAAYLEKPFRSAQLLAAVQQALAAAAPLRPAEAPLDRLLQRAFAARFCGRYTLHCADGERRLVFLNGLPVSLRPGFASADFGDWLRRRGTISAEEYAYYSTTGEYRHEVLVSLGCLDFPELLQEKYAYLSGELVAGFSQPPFAVTEDVVESPPELQLVSVNVPNLLYQGYHRHPRREVQRRFLLRHGMHFVAPTPAFFRHVNFLALDEEEKRILRRLDGSRPLQECLISAQKAGPLLQTLTALQMLRFAPRPLAAAAPEFPLRTLFNAVEEEQLPPEKPLESFADLREAGDGGSAQEPPSPFEPSPTLQGVATASTQAAPQVLATLEALQGKNHYEIFDMTQGDFSFDRLRSRYFELTRELGPDTLMRLSGEEAEAAEKVLATVSTAYNTLSDVVKKERYDELLGAERIGLGHEGDEQFQAQVQSQSGKVFLDMEEWDNAENALQDACNIAPANGDYLAHLAWAIYRNPKNARSRAMQEKARQLLNRAITMERTAAGFTFKGWMLLDGGQEVLAEAEFSKALKLDARQLLARKGMRRLQEKREQQKKGLFRRMFG